MRTLPRKALPIIVGLITGLTSLLNAQLDEAAKKLGQLDEGAIDQAADMAAGAANLASNLEIQSDETSFDETLGIAKAKGNVEIKYHGTTILADQAEFHQGTGDVFARGNVVIYKDGGSYTAEEAIYNIHTSEMTASNLRGALIPIYYDAGDIEIPTQATDMIEMTDSWFTTDDNADPSFKVKAKRIRMYPGDRVTFKNMKFYAGNTPIFWLPYLSQPLDDELGYFFTPGYNSGWGGFLLNQYGFMIGDHTLAQAQLDLRSSRGVAGGIEFKSQRYRNNENFGRLKLYFASDNEPNTTYGGAKRNTDLSSDRYRINLQHRVYFPGPEKSTLYLDIDINKLSDAFIYNDFFPREYTLDPKPDNILNLVKRGDRGTLSLTGRFQLNDFFQTDTRLPELALDVTRQPILGSGLFYQGYTTFGILKEHLAEDVRGFSETRRKSQENYLRMIEAGKAEVKDGQLVTVVDDGEESEVLMDEFDEDSSRSLINDLDLLLDDRSFTRFDTYHEILYPTSLGGWLSVVPRAGIGYTKYYDVGARNVGDQDRTTFHLGIDASFKVSKVYSDAVSDALGINELRHIAQPYVNYSFVNADTPQDGFATRIDRVTPTTRLRPLDLPLFTAVDDIQSWNIARIGIINRLQTKRNQGTFGWFEIDTFFDTYIDDPGFDLDRDFSNLFNNLTWYPLPWLAARVNSQIPVFNQETDFTETTTALTFMPWKNFQFSLGQYYLNDHPFFIDSNLYTLGTYTRLGENWGFSTSHRFETTDNTLEIQQYQVYRDLSAWTASFGGIVRDNRGGQDEWGVVMSFTLKAFPKITLPIDLQPGSFSGN